MKKGKIIYFFNNFVNNILVRKNGHIGNLITVVDGNQKYIFHYF